ncbi:hypothetical protein D0Y65_022369 [Glycine soja]|uniref:Uncharacterized protein n=2 Tax=Glycine subgen. Soja TaxID=1462606 RepID=K7LAB3_SOYBN|nr:hypothetical protein D0Y65_022369 [Glycine soja]
MELTAERDNNGSFNLGLVRVVADGITSEQTVRDTEAHFDHICGTKSCFFAVMRKGGNVSVGSQMITWEVLHSYNWLVENSHRTGFVIKWRFFPFLPFLIRERGPFLGSGSERGRKNGKRGGEDPECPHFIDGWEIWIPFSLYIFVI